MKDETNYGSLFRTAHIFGANFIFLIGKRFKRLASDTTCSSKQIPVFEFSTFSEFQNFIPLNSEIVAIELDKNAKMLSHFVHPKQAIYLLGAEDIGIPEEILDKCNHIIKLPGQISLNVAVAGSIVIYDRISKINLDF